MSFSVYDVKVIHTVHVGQHLLAFDAVCSIGHFTLAASSGKRNVTVCPSVCPVVILTVTHQGAACDAAILHFGPSPARQ